MDRPKLFMDSNDPIKQHFENELMTDLKWALERTKSYANSKGAYSNVEKAEKLLEKYKLNGGKDV